MNSLITPGHVSVTPTFLVALDLHEAEYDDDYNINAVEDDVRKAGKRKDKRGAEEVARIIAYTTHLLMSWGMSTAGECEEATPLELLQSFNSSVQDAIDKIGENSIFPRGYVPPPVVVPSKKVSSTAGVSTAAAVKLTALLDEYDRQVVKDVAQLRTYVTNRLIELSSCGDTKSELKALELLGKISDVGLFVEKSEITITATSPAQIEHSIKEKLNRLLGRGNIDIQDAELVNDEEIEDTEEVIEVAKEEDIDYVADEAQEDH
jgi:hypothetical protein